MNSLDKSPTNRKPQFHGTRFPPTKTRVSTVPRAFRVYLQLFLCVSFALSRKSCHTFLPTKSSATVLERMLCQCRFDCRSGGVANACDFSKRGRTGLLGVKVRWVCFGVFFGEMKINRGLFVCAVWLKLVFGK